MFKGASLSFKLYSGFTTILLIVSALGVFAYLRLVTIRESSNEVVQKCLPSVQILGKIDASVRRNTIFATRHVLFLIKEDMDEVEKDYAENRKMLAGLLENYEKLITDEKERDLFKSILAIREAYVNLMSNQLLPLSREGKKKEAKDLLKNEYETAYNKYRDAVLSLQDYKKASADASGAHITQNVASAVTGIVIGLILALVVGASIGIFLSRSISAALTKVINSLKEGSEQVSSASGQVSQSSQQMAEGASEQASSLEETSASLEEMSSMTKQNSDNAKQANLMAGETRDSVEKSRTAMSRMSEAIQQIKVSSDQTAKIVKTIDEIAFQTNLLALNAAVEAARAGDAGKGFAVVAEEVRNLAQRSAEAAKNTSSLIEQSQKNADNGVAVSQEVATILTQIVESVSRLSQLIGEVSSASMEQAKGIEQIGTAVTQMDKLTQSNAANAEESASASEELSAQANELNDMVNTLVGIVSGSADGRNPQAAQRQPAARKPARAPVHKAAEAKSHKPGPAKPGAKAAAKHDWSPVPSNGKSRNGNSPAMARSGNAESVIPLNDDEMKDF